MHCATGAGERPVCISRSQSSLRLRSCSGASPASRRAALRPSRCRRWVPISRPPRSPACPPAPSWRASSISRTPASSSASASSPAAPTAAPRPPRPGLRAGTACPPPSIGRAVAAWSVVFTGSDIPATGTLEAQVRALANRAASIRWRGSPAPASICSPARKTTWSNRPWSMPPGALCQPRRSKTPTSSPFGTRRPSTPSSPRRRARIAGSRTTPSSPTATTTRPAQSCGTSTPT